MNRIEQYETYFEGVATRLTSIGHTSEAPRFHTMSYEQLLAKKRSTANLKEWNLILLPIDPSIVKNNARQFELGTSAAFEIVKEPASRDNMTKVRIKDEALTICLQIVSKMLIEHRKRTFPLQELVEDQISFYEIESDLDKSVGYGCRFSYAEGYAPTKVYQPDLWND